MNPLVSRMLCFACLQPENIFFASRHVLKHYKQMPGTDLVPVCVFFLIVSSLMLTCSVYTAELIKNAPSLSRQMQRTPPHPVWRADMIPAT